MIVAGVLLAIAGGGVWLNFVGRPPPLEDIVVEAVVMDPDRVRFVAVGDTGEGNATQRSVAEAIGSVCAKRGCDFVLLLGDNLYPRGMDSDTDARMGEVFTAIYGDLGLPFYGVLGNHDYGHGRDQARADRQLRWAARSDVLNMPSRNYRIDAGTVSLWGLDTNAVFWFGAGDQQSWLNESLDGSTARWKFAFGHHPYRSNGQHGNAGAYEGLPGLPIVAGRRLQKLFRDELCGEVDLYLSGHEHNRQWQEACGMQLLVSGAGAKAKPLVNRGNVAVFEATTEGLVWVQATRELRFAFYDAAGRLEHEGVAH